MKQRLPGKYEPNWAILVLAFLLMHSTTWADTIYVDGGSTIYRFNPDGTGSVFATNGLSNAEGLAFDATGNLYVANGGNNTIERFTPSGAGSLFASNGLSFPFGLAFDSAGNLYAGNNNNRSIERFTPAGVASLFYSLGGSKEPRGLAFDGAGNLFVSYSSAGIAEITPGGVLSTFATNGLSSPAGLAFDKAGNLYAANFANSTIEKFTPDGVGAVFATTDHPTGLAFDSSGDLYAVNNFNHTITRFTPDGIGNLFASTGTTAPTYIAIIPEPGAQSLVFAGLALVAARAFRRRFVACRRCHRAQLLLRRPEWQRNAKG